MYIRFKNECGRAEVRDVRHFDIRSADCEEEDGSIIHGAEVVDLGFELAGDFLDTVVEYACGIMLNGRSRVDAVRLKGKDVPVSAAKMFGTYSQGTSALGWFCSWEAAGEVLNDICDALSRGEQFFDLTQYDEEGRCIPDA